METFMACIMLVFQDIDLLNIEKLNFSFLFDSYNFHQHYLQIFFYLDNLSNDY